MDSIHEVHDALVAWKVARKRLDTIRKARGFVPVRTVEKRIRRMRVFRPKGKPKKKAKPKFKSSRTTFRAYAVSPGKGSNMLPQGVPGFPPKGSGAPPKGGKGKPGRFQARPPIRPAFPSYPVYQTGAEVTPEQQSQTQGTPQSQTVQPGAAASSAQGGWFSYPTHASAENHGEWATRC